MQKSIAFLYTQNELAEKEMKKPIPLIIAVQYLEKRKVKCLYNKNSKH
jgi:hypothetical protein